MRDDIPDDEKPIYTSLRTFYRGEAVGGPNNGSVMSSYNLTEFVPRKVGYKPIDYNTQSIKSMSVQERKHLQEAEKAMLKESIWAKQNPHRYDFDMERQVWVYVEYPFQPLEE